MFLKKMKVLLIRCGERDDVQMILRHFDKLSAQDNN